MRFSSFRVANSAACQLVSEHAVLTGAPGCQQGPVVWLWAGELVCFAAAFLQAAKISQRLYCKNCTRLIHSCFRRGGFLASSPPAGTAGSWPGSVRSWCDAVAGHGHGAVAVMLVCTSGFPASWCLHACGVLTLGKHGHLSCSGCLVG